LGSIYILCKALKNFVAFSLIDCCILWLFKPGIYCLPVSSLCFYAIFSCGKTHWRGDSGNAFPSADKAELLMSGGFYRNAPGSRPRQLGSAAEPGGSAWRSDPRQPGYAGN